MKRVVLSSVLFVLASSASADTLTVGPAGSGADFAEIQSAVDAAQPGDTILVAAGSYDRFAVDRPVRILGEGPGLVSVSNAPLEEIWLAVRIAGIPAGTEVVLSGMTIKGQSINSGILCGLTPRHALFVDDSAGQVLLHDLELLTGPPPGGVPIDAGITDTLGIRDSAFVLVDASVVQGHSDFCLNGNAAEVLRSTAWFTNTTLQGGEYNGNGNETGEGAGGDGLEVVDSVVYLARSAVHGGDGSSAQGTCLFGTPTQVGTPGGDGVRLSGSSLLKAVGGPGAEVRAGDAGFGIMCGADGGIGIDVRDTSTLLLTTQLDVAGGMGTPTLGGQPGPRVDVAQGVNATLLSVPHDYPTQAFVPAGVTTGASFQLELAGRPLSLAFVLLSFGTAAPAPVAGVADGALLLDPASLVLLRTTALGASGQKSLALQVPSDPTLEGLALPFQWLQSDGTHFALSNPSLLVIR